MKMHIFFGFPPSPGGALVPVQADTAAAAVAKAQQQGFTMVATSREVDGRVWQGYSHGDLFYVLRPVFNEADMAAVIAELGMSDILDQGDRPLQ